MDFWNKISGIIEAAGDREYKLPDDILINNHIHSPWSYSAFSSVDEIISQAVNEGLGVIGINDFNTIAGYKEWAELCLKSNIFPLFNIEMIGLDKADMEAGQKINDPANPGRTYISGKALAYPTSMSKSTSDTLHKIVELSNTQVKEMTLKVNILLSAIDSELVIDFEDMQSEITRDMVRERHLAQYIRQKICSLYKNDIDRDKVFVELLGPEYSDLDGNNSVSVENLLRSLLLKAGGKAFVPEEPDVFIDPAEIREIILDAGGIPTYPFLADFANGSYTDFEGDIEEAAISLIRKGFYSVEFIPGRNRFELFKAYAMILYEHGFIVTFGTEHNAPGYAPLEVRAGGNIKLDKDLQRINLEGTAILAAHQYKTWKEGEGYLSDTGTPKIEEKEEYIKLGKKLIGSVVSSEFSGRGGL